MWLMWNAPATQDGDYIASISCKAKVIRSLMLRKPKKAITVGVENTLDEYSRKSLPQAQLCLPTLIIFIVNRLNSRDS